MNTNNQNTGWQKEMDKTILRYHVIALWVAVVFDMLFYVTDYFNIPAYRKEFFIFRLCVSLICLATVLLYKKLKIARQIMGVIPVLLISVQNAYMWSVMDAEHLQKHTLAYMALFIGSGMFMFYHWYYSAFIVVINIVANIVFFYVNSNLTLDVILVNGGVLTLSTAIFSVLLIRMRYGLTKREIIARFELKKSKHQIEEKNKEITDSINYAKRIQMALIPPESVVKELMPNSFLIYKPKDIVSGDFYWATELTTTSSITDNEKLIVFCVADCTGHGVPGAFMSLIGVKILNQSVKQKNVNSPAQALDYLNNQVFQTVNKHSDKDNIVRDGMDAVFCAINFKTLKLSYAGANNPIYIIRNGELIQIKADKQPIGSYEKQTPFTNHEFQLQKDDMVYGFTDGYVDQFGGDDGKKMKSKRFKEQLILCAKDDVDVQKEKLNRYFEEWKGVYEQLDDVCLIGIKI
ncbi:SpoIIE family protein phosphatase [Vicingus serpentipes]|uniref:SpoIIE family protein phosphatase n=1 Tax=Vicingus serpentipes TaxID=1926625 RepID=A0A5C6RTT0_9FLAO|nr:SpoIIE family protein phosphatase [Vicingus serpentipes]TXB65080.1 SpoIIE family protein phosphatase [Vicingus serpentipes]